METRDKVGRIFENIVVIAILLVLIQTFLEDFAVVVGWSWDIRKILVFSGFCFDLFFTIEFFTRLFYSIIDGDVKGYIFQRRGWIDFLASIPLLLLNSGPAVLAIVAGGGSTLVLGGFLNVLKVVKAIRIARILRLLRVLKVFKQIKYADSKMAQRHIAMITTITITVFVFIIFAVSIFSPVLGLPTVDKTFEKKHNTTFEKIQEHIENDRWRSAVYEAENSSDLLIFKVEEETLFSRYDKDEYARRFGPSDYSYIKAEDYEAYFTLNGLHKLQSKDTLLYFIIVVVLVIVFLVYYSPMFAITVTDPIHVMKRGMEDTSYNLEVRVPPQFRNDDVFELAALYNEVFLPMKDRDSGDDSGGMADLKMDDFKDILDSGIPDSGIPDSGIPDTGIPDAGIPDDDVPETESLESEILDTEEPEAEFSEDDLSDLDFPDADFSDLEVPDFNLEEEEEITEEIEETEETEDKEES